MPPTPEKLPECPHCSRRVAVVAVPADALEALRAENARLQKRVDEMEVEIKRLDAMLDKIPLSHFLQLQALTAAGEGK